MHTTFKLVLATVTGASLSLLAAPSAVMADDVPDALSVEWQGKKPCEKLFEDAQVRIARCTFRREQCTRAIPTHLRLPTC